MYNCKNKLRRSKIASYKIKKPPEPAQLRYKPGLKSCQITMQSAALPEKEVSLRAANEKQKQKRTRPGGRYLYKKALQFTKHLH
jgi:hypothetical protein